MSLHQKIINDRLHVVYEHAPHARIMSIDWLIEAGQVCERPDQRGWSHLIASLIDHESQKYSETDLQAKLIEEQMVLDGVVGKHCLGLEVHVPSNNWKSALDVAFELVCQPKWQPQVMDQEIKSIVQGIQTSSNDPGEVLIRLFLKQIFGAEHIYAQRASGTQKTLESATPEALMAFYKKCLGEKIILHLVGAQRPEDIFDHVSGFVLPKARQVQSAKIKIPDTRTGGSVLREETSFQKLHGACGFPIAQASLKEEVCLEWIADYFVHATGGLLYERIREDKALVYDIDCQFFLLPLGGCFSICFSADPASETQVIDHIKKEIQNLCEQAIDDQEIKRRQKTLEGRFVLDWDGVSGHIDFYNHAVLYGKTLDYHAQCQAMLDLTPEDIKTTAQKYFGQTNMTQVCLVPKTSCESLS